MKPLNAANWFYGQSFNGRLHEEVSTMTLQQAAEIARANNPKPNTEQKKEVCPECGSENFTTREVSYLSGVHHAGVWEKLYTTIGECSDCPFEDEL